MMGVTGTQQPQRASMESGACERGTSASLFVGAWLPLCRRGCLVGSRGRMAEFSLELLSNIYLQKDDGRAAFPLVVRISDRILVPSAPSAHRALTEVA